MKPILIIKNLDKEGPGCLGDAAAALDLPTETLLASEDELPGNLDQYSGLIIMGGPQGVYELGTYPYLEQEIELSRIALESGLPHVGVCLGSQVMASALNATVKPGAHVEVGWFPISLTAEGKQDPFYSTIESGHIAFHFHGDAFPCPEGAIPLASSALTPCQAFRYGDHAYAFQYHPEVNAKSVTEMIDGNLDYLTQNKLDADYLRQESERHLPVYMSRYRDFFLNLMKLFARD